MTPSPAASRRSFFSTALKSLVGLVGITLVAKAPAALGYSSVLGHSVGYTDVLPLLPANESVVCPTKNTKPLFQFWLNQYNGSLPYHQFEEAHEATVLHHTTAEEIRADFAARDSVTTTLRGPAFDLLLSDGGHLTFTSMNDYTDYLVYYQDAQGYTENTIASTLAWDNESTPKFIYGIFGNDDDTKSGCDMLFREGKKQLVRELGKRGVLV